MERNRTNRTARIRSWVTSTLVLLAVVGADAATSACSRSSANLLERTAEGAQAPAPKVTVALPLVQSIREWTEYTGRAQAVDSVEIRARVSGYLERVAFREGDLVNKGDLLFVVDPRPFAATHQQAEASLEGARAQAALATIEASRSEKLWSEHVIADSERDQERAQLAQRNAEEKRASAQVSETALDLEYSHIRAPISGRIGRMEITPGNLIGPTTASPLTTLVSVNPLHVYIDVLEADAMHLRDAPRVAAVGFAGEDAYPHEAQIDFIDNHVEPSTGTVRVRAVIQNPDGKLTPGLFARVRLAASAPRDAVLVLDEAFGTDQSHKFAYVVGADGKAQYRDVVLGAMHEGFRIVQKGLASDDRVVIHGLQRLRPGSQVDAELAPMKVDGAVP